MKPVRPLPPSLRLVAAVLAASLLAPASALAQDQARRVEIRVDERGYHPGTVHVREGERVVLVFTRTSARGCGGTVVVPSRDIRRELPLNEPVEIALTIRARERLTFTCGMGMYRGQLVVD